MSTPEQPNSAPAPVSAAAAAQVSSPFTAPAAAPGDAKAPSRYSRNRGASKLWIAGALVVGIALGAAGAVGVNLVLRNTAPAPPTTPDDVALSATTWFTESDTLPSSATEPGASLVLGKAAKVLVGSETGNQSVAKITVNAVAALDAKDSDLLKSAQPALAGQKLFRIDYTVEYVSGDPLAGMMIGDAIYPIDTEGAQLLRVPVAGWKKCGEPALPATIDDSADGATPAAPAAMCAVASSPDGGADVVGALFAQAGGPYSFEAKGQLTWLPAN
jgi:hypothetical protein